MNPFLFIILAVPILEIYLFIIIGTKIGALSTISLIILTAFFGIFYARFEGFNTLKSGISQLVKKEIPIYEIVSGAALAFAAFLLILPGFATDLLGLLIIFPPSRKLILRKVSYKQSQTYKKRDYINGEFEDIDDENDKKL